MRQNEAGLPRFNPGFDYKEVMSRDIRDQKVLVAMSGGVDSSVTAALLKTQGYHVIGVHMQLWDQSDENINRIGGKCCSVVDSNDARKVCDRLDIPYYVINTQEVFKEKVVDYFVHEYLQFRTPNPCVMCNNKIKFSYLFQKADELGCDWVATGHYAQVNRDARTGKAHLIKAVDAEKDQSYFLFGITQEALQRTLMPLGGLSKMMVRKLAYQFDLTIADKPDSQEICFIGSEGYKEFIKKNVPADLLPRGIIKTTDGAVVGNHEGLYQYTIGQRKGFELNIKDNKDPFYVAGFDRDTHGLIVGREKDLFESFVVVEDINWIQHQKGMHLIKCKAKIRSRHEEADCELSCFENKGGYVRFADPQRAITPGQAIVFYVNNEIIGGGFIAQVGEATEADKPLQQQQQQQGQAAGAAPAPAPQKVSS